MDGVMHPSVEQAIGRDRIRNALKRYENNPADEHDRGIVRAVNSDGSYEVLLDGDVQTARCAPYANAVVGDRVIVVTTKDGENVLLGRLGGETETIMPTIAERFEGIESEIDLLKTNKVLASAVSYMHGSQTVSLDEAVSAQPHGIVLVFSGYNVSADEAIDNGFTSFFVPKSAVSAHPNCGHDFAANDPTFAYFWSKRLFIGDTSITGFASNTGSGNNSGVAYDNAIRILRYVIGV